MINKTYFRKSAWLAFILLATISCLISCDDDPVIGADLLQEEQITVDFDGAATLKAFTLSQKDGLTSFVDFGLLGNLNDPQFGYSKAGFAAQLRKPGASDFHKHPTASTDSIRLFLEFNSVYGDSVTLQKARVYELNGDLSFNQEYKANFDISPLLGSELGSIDFNHITITDTIFKVNSKGEVEKDTTGNPIISSITKILKVPLAVELGERFLKADSTQLDNQDNFLQFFKGVYVTADPLAEEGGVFRFDLFNSKMRLFYKNNDSGDTVNTQKIFDFNITENSARVNLFEHNPTGAPISQFLDSTTQEDVVVYVQGMTGTRVKIEVDSINTRWDELGKIAINKAELQLFAADEPELQLTTSDTLNVPKILALSILNENGNDSTLTLGLYDKFSKSYRFNIPLYLQKIIDGKSVNKGFFIFSTDGNINPKRVILRNRKDDEKRIKLSVIYTKL